MTVPEQGEDRATADLQLFTANTPRAEAIARKLPRSFDPDDICQDPVRAWLKKQLDKLNPVDAHLLKRTYIDEEDLDTLAKLQGVERAVLSRRLVVTVKRLIKARRAANEARAIRAEKREGDHGEN